MDGPLMCLILNFWSLLCVAVSLPQCTVVLWTGLRRSDVILQSFREIEFLIYWERMTWANFCVVCLISLACGVLHSIAIAMRHLNTCTSQSKGLLDRTSGGHAPGEGYWVLQIISSHSQWSVKTPRKFSKMIPRKKHDHLNQIRCDHKGFGIMSCEEKPHWYDVGMRPGISEKASQICALLSIRSLLDGRTDSLILAKVTWCAESSCLVGVWYCGDGALS